jgi:hypothetical protein
VNCSVMWRVVFRVYAACMARGARDARERFSAQSDERKSAAEAATFRIGFVAKNVIGARYLIARAMHFSGRPGRG